ncbi:MAG: NAD(P)-binding protein [Chitinophagaceae bacterium]|nr:NAD(P)-binding protein [Chitinophagaceae bacterium]
MPKVIILGGGVAGMSAAHELIERGFEVEVYERHKQYPGGKARSVNVPTVGPGPEEPLPGEHGFRFFPGFYKHIIDTMKRIPYTDKEGNRLTVFDNLTPTERVRLAREGKESITTLVNFPHSLDDLHVLIASMHANTGLTEEEKKFFATKVWQLMTSCYDRRANDYERISWWDYLEADRFSDDYRALLVQGLTRTLVAANARKASTKTGGDIFLQLIFNMTNPGVHTDRVLNGPTNEVWLHPWYIYLSQKGVKYFKDHEVTALHMDNGKLTGATVLNRAANESHVVTGDYYLLAVPVERAAPLFTKEMLDIDPTLQGVEALAPSVAWMNGVQYFLTEEVNVVKGHCIYSDSTWAVTSISQLQFWKDYDIRTKADGKIRTVFSVDVSDWDTSGSLEFTNGKPAKDCTHEEIKDEVWHQITLSLNVDGKQVVPEQTPVLWHIDGDIKAVPGTGQREKDEEPLLVNTINSWGLRPDSHTLIPNFFLASDYVRTYTDLATMEGANEAARRAVNSILSVSGSKEKLCEIWNLHEPVILAPFRRHDQKRYDKGLPWKSYETWWLKLILFIARLTKKIIGFFKGSSSK